ncbi:MAG TPA: Asp-tRNA(Asn)/Glu-tRNA(Gln) amidotransferase subunit GatB [Polyangia bacterium]
MDKWEPVIGLEVHVQLAAKSKIFSGASAAFGAEPNASTDPLSLALPGTLPVLNRAVIEMAVRFGLAVGGHIRPRCRFSRKHYFYPDLPKGFQISQFDEPIVEGGVITFRLNGERRQVRLTRIHLEEDAGKSQHAASGKSFVDYNRAGVPLCEVVSEPEVRSAEEAGEYLRAVRTLVRYLGISDGNMEEGSLRCDANVSVRLRGETKLGTKAELKNINSFKNVKDAVEHEIKRQITLLERGERVVQETRLWDAVRGTSASMRSKEQAHDYRYMPEPDLPPVAIAADFLERTRAALPELPEDRFARYTGVLGLSAQDAGVLVSEKEIADYFDGTVAAVGGDAQAGSGKKAANWIINEVLGRVSEPRALAASDVPVAPQALAALLALLEKGSVSGKQAKDVFARMWQERRSAADIVAAEGLSQVSDAGEIEAICRSVVEGHPGELARYRGGEAKLMGFFVGQVLKASGGKANPKTVNELLRKLLA